MKINDYSATLDEKLSEFDMWITPSLGEIRDTPQFKVNLELLKKGFDYIAAITSNFEDVRSCSASAGRRRPDPRPCPTPRRGGRRSRPGAAYRW